MAATAWPPDATSWHLPRHAFIKFHATPWAPCPTSWLRISSKALFWFLKYFPTLLGHGCYGYLRKTLLFMQLMDSPRNSTMLQASSNTVPLYQLFLRLGQCCYYRNNKLITNVWLTIPSITIMCSLQQFCMLKTPVVSLLEALVDGMTNVSHLDTINPNNYHLRTCGFLFHCHKTTNSSRRELH